MKKLLTGVLVWLLGVLFAAAQVNAQSDGAQTGFCIGDAAVLEADFGAVHSGSQYVDYTLVKDADGKEVGVCITGLKSGAVNVLIEKDFVIQEQDASGKRVSRTLPVTAFSSKTFENCEELKKMTINVPDVKIDVAEMFSGCTQLQCADVSGMQITRVGSAMFEGCEKLEGVLLPATVSSIGSSAFAHTALPSALLPEGITEIGAEAFRACEKLKSVYLPDSLKLLAFSETGNYDGPFDGCIAVERISVGGIYTISCGMLRTGSTALEELIIRGTVHEIGHDAFNSGNGYEGTEGATERDRNGYDTASAAAKLVIESGVVRLYDNAFKNCDLFSEIVLPDTLTSIGNGAFYDCDGIVQMELPDSVKECGNTAFYDCDGLKKITLSKVLTQIGTEAFYGCDALESIQIPDTTLKIGERAFGECRNLSKLDLGKGVQSIGAFAFASCEKLEAVYIPDSVRTLEVSAYQGPFSNCTALRKISIGGVAKLTSGMLRTDSKVMEELIIRGSVKTIDKNAFNSMSDGESSEARSDTNGYGGSDMSVRVIIEDGVETIAANAFSACDSITELQLPKTIKTIGNYAFYACTRMSGALELADGLESIGVYAFSQDKALTSLHIPGTCKVIGIQAFSHCTNADELELGNGIETIGDNAFGGCVKLKYLYVPDSVTTLSVKERYYEGPFNGCTSVQRISVGGVKSLASGMLRTGSQVLEELVIRGTVEEIGTNAFNSRSAFGVTYSDQLERNGYDIKTVNAKLVIEEGVKTIGNYAFRGCNMFTEIVLPDSISSIGELAFRDCTRFTHLRLPEGLTALQYSVFNGCSRLETVILPEKLEQIERYAFYNCSNLKGVEIPGTVESIGGYAFRDCVKLKELTISEGVKSIGMYAFENCRALENVRIPSSVTTIESDGYQGPFKGCIALRRIEMNGPDEITCGMLRTGSKQIEEVVIGGAVTCIGADAFNSLNTYATTKKNEPDYNGYNTEVTAARLRISEGVTSIGERAFYNCTVFTEIMLPESLEQIGEKAFEGCERLTHLRMRDSMPMISDSSFSCTDMTVYLPAVNTNALAWFSEKGYTCVTDGEAFFTLTLDANGGVFSNGEATVNLAVAWDAAMPALPYPIKQDQLFSGWYVNAVCSAPVLFDRMPARNVTIYAGWAAKPSEYVDVEEIALNITEAVIGTDEILALRAVCAPADASDQTVAWRSSDETVASVEQNGRVTAIDAGSVVITAQAHNGVTATCELEIYRLNEQLFVLPAALVTIDEQAFSGSSVRCVRVPPGVQAIGAGAFADCKTLYRIWMPESVQVIAADAFEGSEHVAIYAPVGSYAQQYAESNGIRFCATE